MVGFFFSFFSFFEGEEKKTRDLCGQEDIFHLPYNFLRSEGKVTTQEKTTL